MVKRNTQYAIRTTNPAVRIGSIRMKNPVMLASGTYEYNNLTKKLINVKKLGAIVTKTVTLRPQEGNPPPRTCETPSGMLNAIGLQNKGVDYFLRKIYPELRSLKVPIIVSIAGKTANEFSKLAEKLDKKKDIAGIELNLSCPNVRSTVHGRRSTEMIAQNADATSNVVAATRKATKKTIIVKLSPNVTDITKIAKAAQDAGADAISLVNTFLAMAIDIDKRKPKLGNITGGLSGPAIKPIALRMVWEAAGAVKIPVIGMGGIASGDDALEFLIAGAKAVAIGTGIFVNPNLAEEVVKKVKEL